MMVAFQDECDVQNASQTEVGLSLGHTVIREIDEAGNGKGRISANPHIVERLFNLGMTDDGPSDHSLLNGRSNPSVLGRLKSNLNLYSHHGIFET